MVYVTALLRVTAGLKSITSQYLAYQEGCQKIISTFEFPPALKFLISLFEGFLHSKQVLLFNINVSQHKCQRSVRLLVLYSLLEKVQNVQHCIDDYYNQFKRIKGIFNLTVLITLRSYGAITWCQCVL